jgi:hypothetical protein
MTCKPRLASPIVIGSLGLAAPAHAEAVAVVCTLTPTDQLTTVTVSTQYAPCVSATHSEITAGTMSVQRVVRCSCFGLLQAVPSTVTAGLFAGATYTHVITGPSTAITLCTLGLGTVRSIYGSLVATITAT